MRLYKISIRLSSGAIWREWETTCTFAAMEFVHSFGTVGFGLYSTSYDGPAIPEVTQTKTINQV